MARRYFSRATEKRAALIKKWFPEDDSQVLVTLERMGYFEEYGVLYPPVPSHSPTHEQRAMVQWLCEEWDYSFEPERHDA